MYQSYIKEQTISIEGNTYTSDVFCGEKKEVPAFASCSNFHEELYLFLKDWFSGSPSLVVKTSGSTGVPKEMVVEKECMMRSAEMTCSFLKLKKGDKSLLCMSLDYIAGKMMIVRALVAGLDLYPIAPCGNPLKGLGLTLSFDFAAMIPMQVYNSLQSEEERSCLLQVKNLIVGGGAIDQILENELKTFPNNIYSTYGMTETLSHIAMRRLNGDNASDCYIPFPSVSLSLNDENALIIDAPLVTDERLFTNDIVHINHDGSFRIIGRKDNIINSGGIKIQAEEVEQLIKPFIESAFAITSMPDSKFGEIVVLAVENEFNESNWDKIMMPSYCKPKKIIVVEQIPLTETGKINRNLLKKLMIESESMPK